MALACAVGVLTTVDVAATARGASQQTMSSTGSFTRLPLTTFHRLVADPDHGRVFATGNGEDENGLVVLDADGQVEEVVPGSSGAFGMALTPDRTVLYVTMPRRGLVGALDTETLEFTTHPVDPEVVVPGEAAVADGAVWFQDREGRGLGGWDPDTGETYRTFAVAGEYATLFAVPHRPHLLAVQDAGSSESLTVVRVSSGPEPKVEAVGSREGVGGLPGAALPDGRHLLAMGSYGAQVLDTRDLESRDYYPAQAASGEYNVGVATAVRDDGLVAVGSTPIEHHGAFVRTYRPGRTTAARGIDLGAQRPGTDESQVLDPQGLAFGRTRLYAVTTTHHQLDPALFVLSRPGAIDPDPSPPDGDSTPLPLQHFDDVAVVRRADRVFFTGGRRDNGVVVTDLHGGHPQLLEHLPGAGQMVLSRNGRRLYVALQHGDGVAVIDTRTLAVRRIPTGVGSAPSTLALVGRSLWFGGFEVPWRHPSTLGRVDLRTRSVRVWPAPFEVGQLRPDPYQGRRHTVLAVSSGGPTSWLMRLQLPAHGPPRLVRQGPTLQYVTDVAGTPDGLHLLVDSEAGRAAGVLDARTWVPDALLTQAHSNAVVTRDDGLVVLATGKSEFTPWTGRTVTWWRSWTGPMAGQWHSRCGVLRQGLAVSGRRLVSACSQSAGFRSSVAMQVTSLPPVRTLSVDTDHGAYQRGELAHVVAHVVGPPHARPVVRLWAYPRHRPPRVVAHGRVDRDGNLHADVRIHRRTRLVATATALDLKAHVVRRVVRHEGVLVVRNTSARNRWVPVP